jgi:transposase InsO family protein
MLISLHKQATTTPKIRSAIQASAEPAWVVAERYGISEQTVWKWRKRDSVHDLSHTPHKLQTTLAPAQEAVAVTLRTTLLLPLDDLLAVVREFLNPHVSRSGLDRCLRRHGVGNLRALKPKEATRTHSSFKAYEPGYLHIDIKYLPQMADEDRRRYLFVAIDRATRWVFVRVYPAQTAANARRFLRDLARAAPMNITRVLTDNGKAFTDRLFGLRKRAATGQHEFDQLCADLGIEHRLTPPMRPQTNGMVERFNGRIEDVLQSHRFHSGEDLEQTILRYVHLYNSKLPQSALASRTPLQAMKDWHKLRPELFKKQPYYLTGCDTAPVPPGQACRSAPHLRPRPVGQQLQGSVQSVDEIVDARDDAVQHRLHPGNQPVRGLEGKVADGAGQTAPDCHNRIISPLKDRSRPVAETDDARDGAFKR